MFKIVTPTARPVLIQGASFKQFARGQLGDATYQISKPSSFREGKILIFFLFCSYVRNCDPRGRASFYPRGCIKNQHGRGLLGDAGLQRAKLYAFQLQRKRILKFFFFVPMFQIVTPEPLLTRGVSFEQTW